MIQCEQNVKTHPCLRAYFDPEQVPGIVVEQLLEKKRFNFSSPILLEILRFCINGLTISELYEKIASKSAISTEEIDKVVEQLVEIKLLTSEEENTSAQLSELWSKYGWEDALDYYFSTYNYPFLSYEEPDCYIRDKEWMRIYKNEKNPPPIYKDYNSNETVPLLKDLHALDKYNIFDFLSINENFIENELSEFERLSHLFLFTFGKTGKIKFPNQGDYILKTSPSGGSRHPTEAYLYIINPEIIGNRTSVGIFHYSVRNHTLNRLPLNFSSEEILQAAFELQIGPKFPVKGILILSSMVERSMWRYREPRSYRVILNDIGHLLETLRMVATAVGIKTYSSHGYKDSKIEALLELDSIQEPVMRVIGIG